MTPTLGFHGKALLAPAVALICFVGLALFATGSLRQQEEAFDGVLTRAVAPSLQAARLTASVQGAHQTLFQLLTWRAAGAGRERLAEIASTFRTDIAAFEGRLGAFAAGAAPGSETLEALVHARAELEAYRGYAEDTLARAALNDDQAITFLWTAHLVYQKLVALLTRIETVLEAQRRDATAAAAARSSALQDNLRLAGLGGAGALVVIGFLSALAVSGTVRRMLTLAADVCGGRAQPALPLARRDELGRLARALAPVPETRRRLRQAQRDLVRLEKLATLSGMAATVAADLREPVDGARDAGGTISESVKGFRTLVLRERPSQTQAVRFCQALDTAAKRLAYHLQRAVALTASVKGVPVDPTVDARQRFDPGALAEAVVEALRACYQPDGPEMTTAVATGLMMDSHPGVFKLVLTHLIENAVVHAFPGEAGGRIAVRLAVVNEAHLVLSVADDGVGIPPETLDRLWEPGYTTNPIAADSGLGLHLIQGLVTRVLRGRITVSSTPGSGTTFTVTLPRTPAALEAPRPAAPDGSE